MLTETQKRQLDEEGYCILPALMSPELLVRVRRRVDELFEQEGDSAGSEFKQEPQSRRLANCVDKGRVFEVQ